MDPADPRRWWSPERPGEPPYTRGLHPGMYRTRLWRKRMFSGFGTAPEANARLRQLLAAGSDGPSIAFDLPTLMGCDSDDPIAEGEVGRCGVAVDTVEDVVDLFTGVDLGAVTTSMTINGPALTLLAMYVAAAEEAGIDPRHLAGTLQNDILKEFQAQKEYLFPPRPSLRLATEAVRWCASGEIGRWYPVSVSGYHIREAGATAAEELGFTMANGLAYLEAAVDLGLDVDVAAAHLSFFFDAHLDLLEEVAKLRAARRLWATEVARRHPGSSARARQCRFHVQTSGASLAARSPELNLVRTAVEALAAVLGGTQSLHTNGLDEVYGLPSAAAARLALRTQDVLEHESGVTAVADGVGGAAVVESRTAALEDRARALVREVESLGRGSVAEGVLAGIEEGWFQQAIVASAYAAEEALGQGRRVVVGLEPPGAGRGGEAPATLVPHRVDAASEARQRQRLAAVRARRSPAAVGEALRRVATAARSPAGPLGPAILGAVRARATLGEVTAALAGVFGRWREQAVL